MLGRNVVRAEVVSLTDEEMLDQSLVENLFRKNLSDYEVALSFDRMNKVFHKSYEEIGKVSGFSKSHVSNFCRMLQLFDKETMARNPNLEKELKCISEHHARILLRIKDQSARASALRLALSENLSVRELERTVLKLRGWFDPRRNSATKHPSEMKPDEVTSSQGSKLNDIMQIQHALNTIFSLPHEGNFEDFAHLHAFESGFSIYSFFPPLQLMDEGHAVKKEQDWFYSVAPHLSANIEDLRIRLFNNVAIATLCVKYSGKANEEVRGMTIRGTVVFVRKVDTWKIVHEHWSPLGSGIPAVVST